MTLPRPAIALIVSISLAALAAITYAAQLGEPRHGYAFLMLLVSAMVTARLKVKLPGITGNMSVCLPFLFLAAAQLNLLEALLAAMAAGAVQCIPKGGGKPQPLQVLFNLSTMALAASAASLMAARFSLAVGAAGFFTAQSVAVAAIIRLTEGGRMLRHWTNIANQTFPFYVLSAGMASMAASAAAHSPNWQVLLMCLPVMAAIYRSYKSYFRVAETSAGRILNS